MKKAKLTFLGTGTSQGVPIIGCKCEVCSSKNPKNKRFRSSALVEYCGLKILIDAGPDFRMQMLNAGVTHLDAILLTHNHKDHTGGLDDIRALNYIDRKAVNIYCENLVLSTLKEEYAYAFADKKYPGAPEWKIYLIDNNPFMIFENNHKGVLTWIHDKGYFYQLENGNLIPSDNIISYAPKVKDTKFTGNTTCKEPFGVEIIPIRGFHDKMPVLGFRFGNIAYITDMSKLPDKELLKLKNLEHLTLNTVGYKKHHSHFSLDEALELANKIGAKHTWLTHLSHTFPSYPVFCEELEELCQKKKINSIVKPAYDGLIIE